MIHELKTWPQYFEQVYEGKKTFEVRVNNRNFKEGDELMLMEYSPIDESYTGREVLCKVTYVLQGGGFGISSNYVVMSISVIATRPIR